MIARVCLDCSKQFKTWPYRIKEGKGKYCSRGCSDKYTLRKGRIPWNKGKRGIFSKECLKLMAKKGKVNAQKRWFGHTKIKTKYMSYAEKYKNGLERKRFTNQRYKARKRNAMGSHTFTEWLVLKEKYMNMCLCCKQLEPNIKLTEDHIIPLSMGGSDNIDNIQPLCQSCNTRKHAKYISYLPVKSSHSNFVLLN